VIIGVGQTRRKSFTIYLPLSFEDEEEALVNQKTKFQKDIVIIDHANSSLAYIKTIPRSSLVVINIMTIGFVNQN